MTDNTVITRRTVTFRIPIEMYSRMQTRAEKEGCLKTSEYIRMLINRDLATSDD